MKTIRLLVGIATILSGSALAQGKPATPTPMTTTTSAPPMAMTAEQRSKMADAHEKMAACLRSTRPINECHDEMMKSCQGTMGSACPMMGGMMGGMKH